MPKMKTIRRGSKTPESNRPLLTTTATHRRRSAPHTAVGFKFPSLSSITTTAASTSSATIFNVVMVSLAVVAVFAGAISYAKMHHDDGNKMLDTVSDTVLNITASLPVINQKLAILFPSNTTTATTSPPTTLAPTLAPIILGCLNPNILSFDTIDAFLVA
jgi:hypothetical protein